MKNRYFEKFDLVLVILAIAGIIYFAVQFRHTYPEGALHSFISSETAENLAAEYLNNPRFSEQRGLDTLSKFIEIDPQRSLAIFLQESFGLDEAIRIMSVDIPVFRWKIRWLDVSQSDMKINSGGENDASPKSKTVRTVEIKLDGRGRLLFYETSPANEPVESTVELNTPTSLQGGPSSVDSARTLAMTFLASVAGIDTTGFSQDKLQTSSKLGISVYEFSFRRKTTIHGLDQTLNLQTTNGLVTKFECQYMPPASFVAPSDRWYHETQKFAQLFLLIASIVITAVYFFIRFRKGAFDFKLGLFYGGIVSFSFAAMIALEMLQVSWLGTLIVTVFAGGFYFIITAILVAVCASLARDVWPEKYQTFEAIRRGRFFNQNTGASVLRGLLWSFALLGALTAILRLFPDSSVWLNSETDGKYETTPALFVFSAGIWTSILATHCYFLLPLTLVKKRFVGNGPLFATGILLGMMAPYVLDGTSDLWVKLTIGVLLGALYTTLLIRYDYLTLVITAMMTYILQEIAFIFLMGDFQDMLLAVSGYLLFGGVTALAVFSRQTGEDVLSYVPEYVKELEEKQRMEREFEIARQIQDNLLCRTIPTLSAFDIASYCDPAYEVGGDYYDFVQFEGQRIGVVIGDVSGKGVSAAFYMTLAKGILQTQALVTPESTKGTLSRLNDVFYGQIDRGKFISMIYAIFDYDRKVMQMSRAGHNPVLIKKSTDRETESLSTTGMAIGLARGSIFSDQLEEVEVPLKNGDLYVFYTDGFPEARNASGEEFGEERLAAVIQRHASLDAKSIVAMVRQEVGAFVGPTTQHDDMTMIVVKVR